jgi:hypothetical protein
MKYTDGQNVSVGDRVELWNSQQGTVVCSIDDDKFTSEFPRSEWNYLKSGFLVRTDDGELFHYEKPDEDFKLLRPGTAP